MSGTPGTTGRLEKVVVPVLPYVETFELGVACEVFGFDRSDDGLPTYDFHLVAATSDPVRTRFATPSRCRTRSISSTTPT